MAPINQPYEVDERTQLADAIERRATDIVAGWLDRVRADASAAQVPLTDLQDGIRHYLERLATLLRGRDPVARVAASAWGDVASEHALTRVRLGFDVTELVREIVALRRVTAHILREEGLLSERAIALLTDLIDDAMAASLQSYVDYRDFDARRVEAEHIGFLTHELKNPLGVVMMATNQLCAQVDSPAQRRSCDMIERNLGHLLNLIDEVLTTERLQSGDMEVRPVHLTLAQLLEDSLESLKQRARDKRLDLHLEFDPEIEVVADAALTRSAILNLVENAIKYTDAGTVKLQVENTDGEVVVHVRDSCGGISPKQLAIIFEPFKRAHDSKPGTGLGLAITRRAIEAQGGAIYVESSRLGCHFWFTLPRRHH